MPDSHTSESGQRLGATPSAAPQRTMLRILPAVVALILVTAACDNSTLFEDKDMTCLTDPSREVPCEGMPSTEWCVREPEPLKAEA
jgi:hypothetical protein